MTKPPQADDGNNDSSRKQRIVYLVLGVLLAWGLVAGAVALDSTTTDEWEISEGAVFDAADGPEVELGTDLTVDRRHPIPGDGSVDLRPEISISAADGTQLRYDGTPANGLVQVDNMDLNGEATLLHQSAGEIVVSGSLTGLQWRNPNVTSTDSDIRYRGGDLTAEVESDQSLLVIDADTGEVLTTAENSGGTISVSLSSAGSEWENISLLASEGPPEIDAESATPTGPQNNTPSTLAVNIADPDSSEVSIDFDHNGQSVGSDTVDGSGTASASTGETVMGDNQWTVTATDQLGQTATDQFQFTVPDELHIYNESDPDQLVTNGANVEVTFFGNEQVYSRSTADGTVSLEGLPIDQEMTIQIEADGYVTRQTIIRSIFNQQAVYVLPEETPTVNTRFELEDPTGQFEQGDTRILIKKPIAREGETSYETIVADEMGAGGFSTILERDQRYTIEVENLVSGETRSLGPYVASASENVILEVDQISFEFENTDLGYQWGANWENDSGAPGVDYSFDAENGFEEFDVSIRERGDDIPFYTEVYTNGESVQERVIIPESVDNPHQATVIVEWEATIQTEDGETREISGSVAVGPDGQELDPEGVPDDVLELVGILAILIVAGLFSTANVGIGGVVTSLLAGLLWFIGILPGQVSGFMIAGALLLSVMWLVRNARGPT